MFDDAEAECSCEVAALPAASMTEPIAIRYGVDEGVVVACMGQRRVSMVVGGGEAKREEGVKDEGGGREWWAWGWQDEVGLWVEAAAAPKEEEAWNEEIRKERRKK